MRQQLRKQNQITCLILRHFRFGSMYFIIFFHSKCYLIPFLKKMNDNQKNTSFFTLPTILTKAGALWQALTSVLPILYHLLLPPSAWFLVQGRKRRSKKHSPASASSWFRWCSRNTWRLLRWTCLGFLVFS